MIINICHQKGGVGKSTIAVNLAVAAGCDILDLDQQQSSHQWQLIRKNKHPNAYQIICHTAKTVAAISAIFNNYANGKNLIVDGGGFSNDINRVAIAGADVIITPVKNSEFELMGLQKFMNEISALEQATGVEISPNILINNCDRRRTSNITQLQNFVAGNAKMNLLETIIYNLSDYQKSISEGLSASEYRKSGEAGKLIEQLKQEIFN